MSDSHRRFYDRISAVYDLIADAGEHRARERGEEDLALRDGERVLDVGCGTGNSLVRFAREVGPGGRAVGLDVSAGMLRTAERKLVEEEVGDRVDLKRADARELPFDDGTFDAAFLSFALEIFDVEDIGRILEELRRVLRPEGRLGIVAMAEVPEGEKASLAEKTYVWMHRHFPHIVDCRPIDVAFHLRDAGYGIRRRHDLEIWSLPVAVVVAEPDPGDQPT